MGCQCRINPDGSVVVCDACASEMMTALMGLLSVEDAAQVETPTVLTSVEYRGMTSAVNGWLDELEVATR